MKKGDIHIVTDDCDAQDINVILDGKHILCLESSLSAEVLVSGYVSHTWIMDSGAAFHVTPHREWFSHYEEISGTVTFGDNHQSDIVGIGDITLVFSNGSRLVIEDVRHVPKLTCSLISCGRLDDLGYRVDFHN